MFTISYEIISFVCHQIMGNKSSNAITGSNRSSSTKCFTKVKSRYSEPSLFVAIDANDCQRVRSLLRSGHNINKRDANGLTALHLAAINGSEECLQVLIEFGPQLMCCSLRQTTLHFAAQNGTKNMVNMLLDYGSVINARDSMGSTPLASAVEADNCPTVVALLMRGAVLHPDVCVSALQNGFTDILKILLNFMPNIIKTIDLNEFCFTRLTVTGLKVLYFCGFPFNHTFLTVIQPMDWSDYCLSARIRLPPQHYNRDKDFKSYEEFIQWIDERTQQPIPLKCLSRMAFRNACNHKSIETVLSHLKVPKLLENYLLLNDIID